MVKSISFFLIIFTALFITGCQQNKDKTQVQACFTPGENCTEKIVSLIDQAKTSIFIQASAFPNDPIIKALVAAKAREVDVQILFDKSLWTGQNASATVLVDNKIPTSLDKKVALARNNVMIIDHLTVITGSFDFTQAAQDKNADNLLIIENPVIGKRYTDNWQSRAVLAEAVTELPKIEKKKTKLAYHKNKSQKAKVKKKRKTSGFWPFK